MKPYIRWLPLFICALLTACSVMPEAVRRQALPRLPYDEMLKNAAQYQGRTVIVGGYVLEVENEKVRTVLSVLQAPLDAMDKPRKRDLSEGRLLLIYDGFLDPEVYTKDRLVTAAGRLIGSSVSEQSDVAYPYLRIKVEKLHLWPVEEPLPPDVYADPWWFPFYWRHHHPYYYRHR